MRLHEIIIESANIAINHQNPDGSMPAGHNGPYYDPETPVRNTAHYLFLFAHLYQKTGDEKFQIAGEKAISFLLSRDARPFNMTFHCRIKPGKDACNGLIGQAWVIEALSKAATVFQRDDCKTLAKEIFFLHPWNKETAIWQRVDVDGTILPYDGTFNHQLWFAAAGSMLSDPVISERVRSFLSKVVKRVQLFPGGIIIHNSAMGSLFNYFKADPIHFSHHLALRFHNKHMKNELEDKSIGYHAFNLYGLALLKQAYPTEKIWSQKLIKNIVKPCYEKKFPRKLCGSPFGYHYNISGIECAFFLETFFPNETDAIKEWINHQLKATYLDSAHPLSKEVADENTASARIYEAVRIVGNYEVKFD